MDERTARRARRTRTRRAVALAAFIALLVGIPALYLSPLLRVHSVEVVGAQTVDPAEIARLADLEGDSMFDADTAGATDRIASLPTVQSVSISRSWPETVRIEITERTPWGVWQEGSDSYVIDAEGVVLPGVQPPAGAPAIKNAGGQATLIPGDRVDPDAVRLTQALLQRLPEQLALNVTAAEYSAASGLTVTTDAGYRVVVGDSQNTEYKLAVWKEIEAELGREQMAGHVLDLRFGDRPALQ